MAHTKNEQLFSDRLEHWLKGKQPKNLSALIKVFDDRSFAILILLLMFLPATPLPTGGLTHVFEVITMLLCLQMIIGRKTIWLPKWVQRVKLGPLVENKAVPLIMRRVRWFEKHASPRWRGIFKFPLFDQLIGIVLFAFALGALLSPPFSFLDTLPSLGAVIVSLALILEDAIMLVAGIVVGSAGIVITITLANEVIHLVKSIF